MQQLEVALDGSTVAQGMDIWEPPRPHPSHCASMQCFSDLVRARADSRRTVVLAMTNAGFAPFWHNLRCSMERLNVSQHAIIVGTDEEACTAAASDSVPCVVGSRVLWDADDNGAALSQGAERHGTAAYARLMHIKARPALAALRLGYDLIFTDTDVVWLRDPLRALRKGQDGAAFVAGELDVLIQSDYDQSNDAACTRHEHCARSSWCDRGRCAPEVCGGFYLLRAGSPAIALLEALFARMAWQREHVDERIGEQPALNYVLRRTAGVRYKVLSRQLYPNGNGYFVHRVRPPRGTQPVIVHNNWIGGYGPKRERFVQHGFWFLPPGPAGDDDDPRQCIHAAV